jgi:uncharacterized protein (TIGR00299 family) protein
VSLTKGGQARRRLWWHCFAGISGDMALGSLLAAGAPPEPLMAALDSLGIGGWDLEVTTELRGGMKATRAKVVVTESPEVPRGLGELLGMTRGKGLSERVASGAEGVLRRLASVEAQIHGEPLDGVYLHELGGHDTLLEVVGTLVALELLGIEEVFASPVALGKGLVGSRHGTISNPAPATVALLAGIPVFGRETSVELTTPTGAALLAELCSGFGVMPAGRLLASGYGAGAAELPEVPNCLQAIILDGSVGQGADRTPVASLQGKRFEPSSEPDLLGEPGQEAVLLEVNLDDVTGETLAHVVASALEAGALDAWVVPALMKKGRPGHVASVLVDSGLAGEMRELMRRETGSFGVRSHLVERWPVPREILEVEVSGHPVRVKVAEHRVKPELEDLRRVAAALGWTLEEVGKKAEALARVRLAGLVTDAGSESPSQPKS